MVKTKGRLSKKDEFARRGHAMYVRRIRPKLGGEKKGRVVAVDIESGDYAVADKVLGAADKLFARRPKARIWFERVGYPTLIRIGTWHDEESTT